MSNQTPNGKILESAWRAVRGDLAVNLEHGFCLDLVRGLLADAFDGPWSFLYDSYVTEWVQPEGYDQIHGGHWARDAEKSLRDLGMGVHEEEPGDLLFDWRRAWSKEWGVYVGHVAVLVDHGLVLENVDPQYRTIASHRGALCLTPRATWGTPTLVARFDPTKKAKG
jgi:hypothetical protein